MKNLIAFGYYGGKNSKLKFILPQLETEHRMFVELCGGSAAVLLNKPRSEVEVLNDLADEVAIFWRVLREQPDKLIEQINNTPAGESEFKRILSLPPSNDDVEMARRFYTRVLQAYSGIPSSKSHALLGAYSFTKKRKNLKFIAERIRDVCVENTDAVRLIKRVITTEKPLRRNPILFYVDPPYTMDSRVAASAYIHDDFDHDKFLDAVLNAPDFCKFAISGYDNKLYNDRLTDWHRVELDTALKSGDLGSRRTEILWRNYELTKTGPLL